MAETGIHVFVLLRLLALLRFHFRDRMDSHYFAANMYLYYREGQPKKRRAPDLMVIKGVDGRFERRSFKTWVEKAVPCFILEATSKKTAREDQVEKKRVYEELGVREYFLFDPLHEYLPEQFLGYRLVGGHYERLPLGPGDCLISEELNMRFVPEGYNLLLFDMVTGQQLSAPEEQVQELRDDLRGSRRELQETQVRLQETQEKLQEERNRREALAAELARLKRKGR